MSTTIKHHYRSVLKSNHLGVADLEELQEQQGDDAKFIFTIKHVRQEINVSVAGRQGDFNIVYFNEKVKPLVLNATNSKTLRKLANSVWLEDWSGLMIELFIDSSVMMMGENTGGVRISPKKVVLKTDMTLDHPRFDAAKKAWNSGKSKGVLSQFNVSADMIAAFETPAE